MAEVRLPTLNKVMLTGRLTRDPETRYTPSGAAVCNMGIAVNRRYRGSSGEWQEEVCYVNIVAWSKLAERLGETLKKGSAVMVEGRLQSRSWETKDGQKRNTIEVNALSVQSLDKRSGGYESGGGHDSGGSSGSVPEPPPADGFGDAEDEVPF
ncbi:MAG: single-stranded DNA-binding protein [Gemmatimonadetes bacterium]|nr:single-stranded DNA-binding protein [Gemmatimonadota bacterium]